MLLDMKTIIFSYVLTDIVCVLVILALWRQSRKRFAGVGLAIINDILDFSKIEAGKLEVEVLDFDLHNLLEDFAEGMALHAHGKGLELLLSIDSEVPERLRGDPGRLRQVLTNLAANVGGESLRAAALEIEAAVGEWDLEAAGEAMAGLEEAFGRLKEAMREVISEGEA